MQNWQRQRAFLILQEISQTPFSDATKAGCCSRANFESAPAPAPELFAILSLLKLHAMTSWEIFQKRIFLWDKDNVEWKIRSRGLV